MQMSDGRCRHGRRKGLDLASAIVSSILISLSLSAVSLAAASPDTGQDWPQWRGARRDGVWRETGIVQKFSSSEIPVKWRAPLSNGYSGPTVADGRVYVSDRVTEPKEQERIHCFNSSDGKKLWTVSYDCSYAGVSYPNGPRASVTVHDGRAYSLGTMGHLYCLDAVNGKLLWAKGLHATHKIRMPDWGIAAAPVVEGNHVIVMVGGAPDACIVAFDRKTGMEAWKALPDRASYSAPIVIEQAGKRVLVCWTAERVAGLDPATGKLYWEAPFKCKTVVDPVVTPVVDGDLMFVSSVYGGSLLIRLATDRLAATKVWERHGSESNPEALHSLIPTPILQNGHIYGIDYWGEMRCLNAENGDRVWEDKSIVPRAMWASAHLIRHGDRVFLFNEKGQLMIGKLSPKGYTEISRAHLLKPTRGQLNSRGGVVWSHPAFAYGHIFARNDEELICADLRATSTVRR